MNFSDFTLNNQGVTDLGQVAFDAIFKYGKLFNTCSPRNGVKNGQIVDSVDKMNDIGWAGRGCNPEYKEVAITGREAKWELGDWSIPLKFCYEQLMGTIAEYCLRTGTPKENIIGTEFWNKIYLPLLNDALERMYWRFAWFNDTNAKVVGSGGVLKAGTDPTLFTASEGLWKRIAAAVSANSNIKTTIAANNQSTYASQISAMRANGAAINAVESILADANSLIKDGVLMVTKSIADALQKDYRREFKATIPYMAVAEGVQIPSFDGVGILVVPEWDTIIRGYEDDGTKWNLPHRAVFTNVENLLVGTEDTSIFASFDTGFDAKARENYTYAASNIGTHIKREDLMQVAY